MSQVDEILESPEPKQLYDAGNLARAGNYLIDVLFSVIVILALGSFFGNNVASEIAMEDDLAIEIVFVLGYVLLMFIFEVAFGKTPGKFLTRCHVVDENGNKPSLSRLIGRNLARLIPFDGLSFLFGRGWHDSVSKTRVVLD